MTGIAQRDHRRALLAALCNGQLHRLQTHPLADAHLAVHHRQRAAVQHHLHRAPHVHLAVAQPFHICLRANDPMRVVPRKISLNQVIRYASRLRLRTAHPSKRGLNQPFQCLVIHLHAVPMG